VRIRRLLTLEDQGAGPYVEVPFEVRGASSLEVSLSYDPTSAVVDLGCEGAEGWRGWSGGAKSRFVIRPDRASGGYVPGELEDGVWKVVLGLHRVPAEGVDVTLDISIPASGDVEPEPAAPRPTSGRRRPRRGLPSSSGLTWLAGDCHAHSLHSDGRLSIRQLAAQGAARGLDFVAVTEHNTVSHFPELAGAGAEHGITLLPGQEVTTSRGHANAFGRIGWVDFRRHPDHWLEQCEEQGGFLSVNHPIADDCAWQWPLARKPRHAEIMHSTWLAKPADSGIWAWWTAWGTDVVPLGGGDFHRLEDGHPVGAPTTWVASEGTGEQEILDALRHGRTAVSLGTDGPLLLRVDGQLTAIDAEGAVFVTIDGGRRVVRSAREDLPDDGGPYRLETPDRRILAISQ
jgi:hypothetical protein